jgi:hypothetical protein
VIAHGGDQLHSGDRVATGPGTRARLRFVSGDETRLDSGTLVQIALATASRVVLAQSAGQTWNRVLSGADFAVAAGGRTLSSAGRGTEFAVAVAGSSVTAEVFAGSVEAGGAVADGNQKLEGGGSGFVPAPMTDAELNAPWAALNQALGRDPSPAGPAALGNGMLLPGEVSAAQQGVAVPLGAPAPDLVFTADWTVGDLELDVLDPDGALFQRLSGPTRPISLVVPAARPGGWQYRVRQLDGGEAGDAWFVVISVLSH